MDYWRDKSLDSFNNALNDDRYSENFGGLTQNFGDNLSFFRYNEGDEPPKEDEQTVECDKPKNSEDTINNTRTGSSTSLNEFLSELK